MIKLPKYKYIFALLDLILVNISLYLSVYFVELYQNKIIVTRLSIEEIVIFSLVSLTFTFIFQSNNLYKIHLIYGKTSQLTAIIRSFFYGDIILILLSFFFKVRFIIDSRLFILFFTLVGLMLFLIFRIMLARKIIRKYFKVTTNRKNILIIGGGRAGILMATKILFEDDLNYNLIGFIDDNIKTGTELIAQKSILGSVKELVNIVEVNKIDEVIIAIDNIEYNRLIQILEECNKSNVNTKIISELFQVVSKKIDIEKYAETPLVEVSPRINAAFNSTLKRIVDIILSIIGIILLSPFLTLVAILIKLTSKGPIFYTHTRIGLNGKPFEFYKFRSMTISNDDDSDRKKAMAAFIKEGKTQSENGTKIINEARVTQIGKFIRKTSIDELPQLLNVIKGDMSLVGPRPCLPYEYELYDEWQKKRFSVLPGCTGVWQVFGRTQVSFKDSVVLDLYYVSNMTPWLDLQLIIKTIPVMLLAKGGK